MSQLRLHNVVQKYRGHTALDRVSIDFASQQTHAIVGPSGCGKTTILKVILGLVTPESGTVSVGDQIVGESDQALIRQSIGYVIQEGGLFPHLTAHANATLIARHLQWPSERIEARVAELSSLVDLTSEQFSKFPSEMSGGQQQRVGLVRALMLDPPVILMDEPLGALDPMIRSRLQDDLKSIFGKLKKTVVFVTHDLGEAAYLADSIVLMREGQVEQIGSMADLLNSPSSTYVSEFVTAQRSLVFTDAP